MILHNMTKKSTLEQTPSAAHSVPSFHFFKAIMAIVKRHFMVWWVQVLPSLASNIASPLLYLFALGFGLGAVIESIGDVPYLAFVLPGVVAHSAFFSASFECSINSYSRMVRERVYAGILSTPVRLIDILIADALFASGKALLSATSVFLVGFMVGGVQSPMLIFPVLILVFVNCFFFACIALFMMSFARTNEFFSYFFTFWMTPSLLFCGIFFEVSRFPEWVQYIAWSLPMTHFVHLLRTFMVDELTIAPLEALCYIGYVILFGSVCLYFAHQRLQKRLLDK